MLLRTAHVPTTSCSRGRGISPERASVSRSRRSGLGELRNARAEQVLDPLRDRDLLADPRRVLGPPVSGRPLEQEQRVALRRVEDLAHDPAREVEAESLGQDPPGRAAAERADLERVPAERLDHAVERGSRPGSPGEEEGNLLVPEPPGGERQGLGGGPVEPLDVVDCDDERLPGRQPAQDVQEAERDRALSGVGRLRARRGGGRPRARCAAGRGERPGPRPRGRRGGRLDRRTRGRTRPDRPRR